MTILIGLVGLMLALSGIVVAGVALVRGNPTATSRRWVWVSAALVVAAAACFVVWGVMSGAR